MTLVPVDTTTALARSEDSVLDFLENAKALLTSAVAMTATPDQVLSLKSQIVMAETYARELALSKDIREQSQEMVRRAEWQLEQAIKRDRAAGLIKSQSDGGGVVTPGLRGSLPRSDAERDDRPSAKDFFGSAGERSEVFQIGQATAEEFEEALAEARADGNLSRANVVRNVRKQAPPSTKSPNTRDQRAELIEELAAQGYTSRQMPSKVGVSEESVRKIARDFGIDIPADRTSTGTRRIDSTRIVTQTATALEGLAMGLELIDFASLDLTEAGQWTDSLSDSLRALNRFHKQLKETIQ